MKTRYIALLTLLPQLSLWANETKQININRIEQMPSMPTPYQMRDWKQVAIDYDNFLYDLDNTHSEYCPLVGLNTAGNNYPQDKQIWMKTFVGSSQAAEAINILPSIVGATLVGVDKSNQHGVNWVDLSKDFFNSKNGQNVYLNNYSAKSGHDWWYDLMPNVYFYQLYSLYPKAVEEHSEQFIQVADRWLDALYKLGGKQYPWTTPNMNHRAFNLETGKPLTAGVKEPESAASIAWLLYQAYCQSGDKKYLDGAQLSMDFLQKWSDNPSYELQLPYGVLAAVRMNAEQNTNYNIEKLFSWCFDMGNLRKWGCIVGNWSGYDVSGLIGEAKDDKNDYAFLMNGFQHAAALAPIAKYDPRYARALGKWLLNLANASHLLYRTGLPKDKQQQDSYNWSITNDANACIPYEAMKEDWQGNGIMAMGDAFRSGWSETDMSLYSGSSVGYMGAIINHTNVEGILQLDLNCTDFFVDSYPTYLYYNPHNQNKEVTIHLPLGEWNIYSLISHTTVESMQQDSVTLTLQADKAEVLVLYPTTATIQQKENKLYAGDKIIDYYYENFDSRPLRIKSFYSTKDRVLYGEFIELFALVDNIPQGEHVSYQWYINGEQQINTSAYMQWSSPSQKSQFEFKVVCSTKSQSVEQTKTIVVSNDIYPLPDIKEIRFDKANPIEPNNIVEAAVVFDSENASCDIAWVCDAGKIIKGKNDLSCRWQTPGEDGVYELKVIAKNEQETKTFSSSILVKNKITEYQDPTIYLPFNGDVKNYANAKFVAQCNKSTFTGDAKGIQARALLIKDANSLVWIENDDDLNFQEQVALSFWFSPTSLGDKEQFIISHGSWEERFKVSITPEKKLRWTIKTDYGVRDVDSRNNIEINKYYHCVAQYTGYSVELYLDGELQSWLPLNGIIPSSNHPITLSQKDEANTEYGYEGIIDEFRLYPISLGLNTIENLRNTWDIALGCYEQSVYNDTKVLNRDNAQIRIESPEAIDAIKIYSLSAIQVASYQYENTMTSAELNLSNLPKGVYIIAIQDYLNRVEYHKIIIS